MKENRHKVGVIGIGNLGKPIAINLYASGLEIMIYARRQSVARDMEAQGIKAAETPKQLGQWSDIIIDLLTDTKATWDVLNQSDGLLEGLDRRKILIDMTTSDPDKSIQLGKFLKEKKVDYLDAPITGGTIGAKSRNLVLMVGGNEQVFNECRYLFETIAKKIFYLGKTGSGHYMKLIHNQLSQSTFLAACEAAVLGMKLGLPLDVMIDVFNAGNARSYATEVRFPRFILPGTYDAGATFKTVHKDIGLVMEKVRQLGYNFPITGATYDYWDYPVAKGSGDADYSTIFKLLDQICQEAK